MKGFKLKLRLDLQIYTRNKSKRIMGIFQNLNSPKLSQGEKTKVFDRVRGNIVQLKCFDR